MSENKSTGIITAENLKELKDHCKKQSESERLGYEHRLVLEIIYKYESLIYENENLKCCGNCKYPNTPMVARPANCKKYEPGSCCSSWEFDGKERIIREKRGN